MRHSRQLLPGLVAAAAILLQPQDGLAQSAGKPEPFGQEKVETRAYRNPPPVASRPHRHAHGATQRHDSGGRHAGHGHAPGSTHRHDTSQTGHRDHPGGHHGHGIETENLFGFTLGSDTEHAGAKGVAIETIARFGKRTGSYTGVGSKLELAYGITDNVSAALALFASHHNVANVRGFDDVKGGGFNGLGGELRWRLVPRTPSGFGVTLHLEPGWQTHDELTGLKGTKFGSENKLIFDRELVPGRMFAAFNLLYDFEHVREDGASEPEKVSKIGLAAALTGAITPGVFVGGEVRYLRAYEGLVPETFAGDALYIGPTLFARLGANGWISAAWNVQVAGHEVGRPGSLDLTNFERHQVRLKVGMEF